MTKELSASLEDYLEAIYNIEKTKRVARVKDIADKMQVTMPAVTGALKHLNSMGHVNYTPYEYIELTESGRQLAEMVVSRHATIKNFLMKVLDIPEEQASNNACRMEHIIDDEVLERMIKFIDFTEEYQNMGEWLVKFRRYYLGEL